MKLKSPSPDKRISHVGDTKLFPNGLDTTLSYQSRAISLSSLSTTTELPLPFARLSQTYSPAQPSKMSYYFTILSPTDAPLFNIAFGTSKSGGDGIARFRFPDTAQYMNQFIIHSSLDILEEAQWTNGNMYVPVFFWVYLL